MAITFDDVIQNSKIDELHKEEEEELIKVLSDKYGLPYVDLRGIAPEPDAIRMIKEEDARAALLAAFKVVGRRLYVGVYSPQNPKVEELLRPLETRGMEIVMFVCSHASLEHVFARYADMNEGIAVESGMLELTGTKMTELMASFATVPELTAMFQTMSSSQILYKISRMIELMFAGALKFGASDVHIEPEEGKVRLRYRLNGNLVDIAFFDQTSLKQITSRLKLLSSLKLSTLKNAQDGRFSIDLGDLEIEVRVSIIPGNYGESFVMRLLDPRNVITDLSNIAFPAKIRELVEYSLQKPNGVILTTGPTGSGKTTTLYAFLHKVYNPEIKILTIEDPVEYHLEGITQTQVSTEKGYTFLSGLRAALRQDPDVIMVGEIRDADTAKVAINAALTGHLVFSTLHTNNAAGTLPRLIDLGVNPKIIASALSLALAQRLVRTLCETCKQASQANDKEVRIITNVLGAMVTSGKTDSLASFAPASSYTVYHPVGCANCNGTGYKGRIGLFEALQMTPAIEKLLDGNPSEHEIKNAASAQGIPTLREDGIIKVLQGVTSLEEVTRVVDVVAD